MGTEPLGAAPAASQQAQKAREASAARGAARPISCAISTGFGIGLAPVAPGTAASMATAALWACVPLSVAQDWLVAALLTVIGVIASHRSAGCWQRRDPSQIVIDEMAGMWITVAGLPRTWSIALAGLLLFRFFDIVKPGPIRELERAPGGFGIMLDDLASGLLARMLLALLLLVYPAVF